MKMLLIAAALAAVSGGASAHAQDTQRVRSHDLDLTAQAGVDQLDRRIAGAVRRVCIDPSSSLYGSYSATRDCVRETRRVAALQRIAAINAARGVALAGR